LEQSKSHSLKIYDDDVAVVVVMMEKKVTGRWRKLYSEELHNLYSSPNSITVIKQIRVRSAGHEVRVMQREMHTF